MRQRADLQNRSARGWIGLCLVPGFSGIPALDLGFGGEDGAASITRSMTIFTGTRIFGYQICLMGGRWRRRREHAVMRLADAEVLPYNFNHTADTVAGYVDEVKKLLKTEQDETAELNQEIDEGVFEATSDPQNPTAAPKKQDTPPFLNFAPLENGSRELSEASKEYQKTVSSAAAHGGAALDAGSIDSVNQVLMQTERAFFRDSGLPERPYFKHQLYAPGAYTGYGVKTLPAVRESIEQRKWAQAEKATVDVGKVLEDAAAVIRSANEKLKAQLPAAEK
jgi:N-acetylated-alpha-linked acidic dipeptidase